MAAVDSRWASRLTPGPLMRRAIGFGWRNRGSLVAGVATVVLLCAARAAPALITDATADRAFAAEVAGIGENVPYDRRIGVRAYVSGVADTGMVERLEAQIERLPVWGEPSVAFVPERYEGAVPRPVPVIRRSDRTTADVTAVLYARTGAIESLTTIDGAAGDPTIPGVWVPEAVAAQLDVAVGDTVELELVETTAPAELPPGEAEPEPMIAATVVAGIYRTDAAGLPVSSTFDWQAVSTELPNSPNSADAVAPLLISGVGGVVDTAAAMGDTLRVTWDTEWEGPYTFDRGQSASGALTRLAARARDPFDDIGALTNDAGIAPLRLASGVTSFVERSADTASALRPLIDSMAVAIQLICALVVAAGVWLLAMRRRREVQLELSHGMHPLRLGLLGVVEQWPAIVIGGVVTWFAVDIGADLAAGAGSVSPSARDTARDAVIGTLPWVVCLMFVVWAVAAASAQPARSSVMKAVAPALRWEVVVTVLAVAAGYQLASEEDASGSSTALLFPILAALSSAALAALVVGAVVRRLRSRSNDTATRRPRHLGRWLCGRRIAAGLSDGAAVIVVVATGVGLLGYTASAASAADAGVAAKAAVLAGARNTAVIPWSGSLTPSPSPSPSTPASDAAASSPEAEPPGMPTGLPAGWSIVWHDRGVEVGPSLQIDIEVVDPATFGDAAEWRSTFADDSLDDLLRSMAAVPDDRVGIVVSGFSADAVPASGSMSIGFWTVAFDVVARVEALPGLADRSTMALIDATRLFALIPPNEVPTQRVEGRTSDNPDGNFRTSVWSSGPSGEFVERLDDAALGDIEIGGSTVERARPDLVAYGWSLPVLRTVGAVALGLAVLAMAMHVIRRRSATVVDIAMMRQIGITESAVRVAVAGELVASASIGSVVGVLLSAGLGRFMTPRLDPDPVLRPQFAAGWSIGALAIAVGVALLAAALISLRELRVCRRAPRSEVFRVG